MSGWQPIETAPKDGTLIDVWVAAGQRFTGVKWDTARSRWVEWSIDGFDDMAWCRFDDPISHWMMPPAPPSPTKDLIPESNVGVREALARAIAEADAAFGYSFNMTKLVDGVATHTLAMDGFEPVDFEDREDGYRLIEERRNKLRADAILSLLSASIDVVGKAREALEQTAADFDDLADLARKRVDDGDEMGSPYWRQALTDIAQEARDNSIRARTALASLTGEGL